MLSKSEQFELPLSLLLMEMPDLFQTGDTEDAQHDCCKHTFRWLGSEENLEQGGFRRKPGVSMRGLLNSECWLLTPSGGVRFALAVHHA